MDARYYNKTAHLHVQQQARPAGRARTRESREWSRFVWGFDYKFTNYNFREKTTNILNFRKENTLSIAPLARCYV